MAVSYSNLVDLTGRIYQKVIHKKALVLQNEFAEQRVQHPEYVYFIVSNSLGDTFYHINKSIYGLTNCQVSKANDLIAIKTYLCVVGACILAFSLVVIILFSVSANKKINYL